MTALLEEEAGTLELASPEEMEIEEDFVSLLLKDEDGSLVGADEIETSREDESDLGANEELTKEEIDEAISARAVESAKPTARAPPPRETMAVAIRSSFFIVKQCNRLQGYSNYRPNQRCKQVFSFPMSSSCLFVNLIYN